MEYEEKKRLYQDIQKTIYIDLIAKILGNKDYDSLKPEDRFKLTTFVIKHSKLSNKFAC